MHLLCEDLQSCTCGSRRPPTNCTRWSRRVVSARNAASAMLSRSSTGTALDPSQFGILKKHGVEEENMGVQEAMSLITFTLTFLYLQKSPFLLLHSYATHFLIVFIFIFMY